MNRLVGPFYDDSQVCGKHLEAMWALRSVANKGSVDTVALPALKTQMPCAGQILRFAPASSNTSTSAIKVQSRGPGCGSDSRGSFAKLPLQQQMAKQRALGFSVGKVEPQSDEEPSGTQKGSTTQHS